MSATVIKLNSSLAAPNGKRIKYDPLDTDQTALILDFAKPTTFPAQSANIPDLTVLTNMATTHALHTNGMVSVTSSVAFSAANKCITLDGSSGGTSDELRFGTSAAPYPQLVSSGEATDMLFTIWIKPDGAHSGLSVACRYNSTRTAGSNVNFNSQFVLYRDFSAGNFTFYILGQQVSVNIPYTADKWVQLGFYVRTNTLNGKSGLIRLYKNGVQSGADITTNVPNAFFTNDTTTLYNWGAVFGGFWGSIGRNIIMKGLDSASLSPDSLVATDFAYGNAIWSTT